MKVLYLALAGGSPEHDHHQQSQEMTWAANNDANCRVIWMHGDPTISTPKLLGHHLYLPVEERYENLLEKTILGVNWALENLQFDYLIRTNTSNYFYSPLVKQHLAAFSSYENVSGGVIADWRGVIQDVKKTYTYISGAGIFLSKKSAEFLGNLNFENYINVPDDVAIGHWLQKNQTQFISIPRNNVTDFKPIWPSPQTRVKSWMYPEVTSERMLEIHAIYQSSSAEELLLKLRDFEKRENSRSSLEKPKRKVLYKTYVFVLDAVTRNRFAKALNLK